ncbi:uncharacterized protein LOC132400086 [Hypanus sabinus]|uniref:uncharacterized protein LOC132400086 n=1 Tax=Hypanus sabinus TaxID=79690 RepID=UPI0028C4DD98|nr:uncharacterized protein LOC132400086 [Hypanus sabinus]
MDGATPGCNGGGLGMGLATLSDKTPLLQKCQHKFRRPHSWESKDLRKWDTPRDNLKNRARASQLSATYDAGRVTEYLYKRGLQKIEFLLTAGFYEDWESKHFSSSPAAVSAHVGQKVELSCEHTHRLEVVSSILWYKQHAAEPPVAIKATDCQKTGCRMAYKKGSGERTSVLEIREVRVEDSGTYYCARLHSYSLLAKGPTLLVGDSSTNRTNMLVFVPPSERNGSVPLVCLVGGLSSTQINIYWNISGQIMDGLSDNGMLDSDRSYSVRSQVLVPVETWRSGGVCTCIAQLGGMGKTRTKSVSHHTDEPDQGWCLPTVILLATLVFPVILIAFWTFKVRRSGTHRQSATRQGQSSAAQSEAPILYASLEFAASSQARR